MKNLKYYSTNSRALLGVLLFIFPTILVAQNNIIDRVLPTNYKSGNNFYHLRGYEFEDKDDSTLVFSTYEGGNDNVAATKVHYWINKNDLSIRDTAVSWRRDTTINYFLYDSYPVSLSSLFIQDQKWPNNKVYFNSHLTSSSVLKMHFNKIASDYRADTTVLFELEFNNRGIGYSPFLYDSSIYMFTRNFPVGDTGYLSRYNMSGDLLKQKILTLNFSDPSILVFPNAYGPTEVSPLNDSLLVYGDGASEIQFVNRFSMDKVAEIRLNSSQVLNLAANEGWMSMKPFGFILDSNEATFYGALSKAPRFGQPDFSQYYRITADWNGNIIDKVHHGNTSLDNYPGFYQRNTTNEYFAGSVPYSAPFSYVQEYRQILVFNVGLGKKDSLFIYGQKNHSVARILLDNKSDLYVLSNYSNAWSDDSIFTVITKIPHHLFVSIRENQSFTSVEVFPNPTTDFLRIKGINQPTNYKVYSINGQVVLDGTIIVEGQVDVSQLKPGSYFINLSKNGVAQSRATVFIKQ
ncbi:T9SS type A sorting domain-containing protein [bacterium]|nr:T9SS type A sorting domain-containing protein [bacterium]